MTKEAMMDDLIKRSAAETAGVGGSQTAVGDGTASAADAEPVWQEAGGGFNLEIGKLKSIFVLIFGSIQSYTKQTAKK